MKKILKESLLFLVLLFFLFNTFITGCNYSEQKREDETFKLEEVKDVTLKFFFFGQENPDSRKILDEIEKKVNVRLDFEWISFTERQRRLDALFASGDNFDALASLADGDYNPEFYKLSREGYLLNITELFPNFAPGLYMKYAPEELVQASYNGNIMGIPARMPLSLRMSVMVRKDLMEKFGLNEISTLENYETYLKAINEGEVKIPSATWLNTIYLFPQMYGYFNINYNLVFKMDDADMKLIPWEQTPEFKEAYYILKDWNNKGYINNRMNIESSLVDGNLGSLFTPWVVADYYMRSVADKKYEMKTFALYSDKPVRLLSNTTAIVLFNKNAQNPERALNFLEWVQSSQENYDLLMYGIEGEQYSLKGRSLVFPEGKNKYSGWDGNAVFTNIDYIRPFGSYPPDYWTTYRENVLKNSVVSPVDGFIPDISSITDMINKRQDEYDFFENGIKNGLFNDIVLDDFIKKQKDTGIDLIVTNLQKQLDKWREIK